MATSPATPPAFRQRVLGRCGSCGRRPGRMRSGAEAAPWPEASLANIGGTVFAPFDRLRREVKRRR